MLIAHSTLSHNSPLSMKTSWHHYIQHPCSITSTCPHFCTNSGHLLITPWLPHMCGHWFSKDIQWLVIRAQYHDLYPSTTAALTGVSEQQIQKICNCYSQTGEVQTENDQWGVETQGQNSKLTTEHQQVRLDILLLVYNRVLPCQKLHNIHQWASDRALLPVWTSSFPLYHLQVSQTYWLHVQKGKNKSEIHLTS